MDGPGSPPPPPPPLPTCKPPQIVQNGTATKNGDQQQREDLLSDIRTGVKLKANRDQILHCSRTPNGGLGAETSDSPVSNGDAAEAHLKKTVHNELRDKLDEVDGDRVLPSQINPDGPAIPPPMHIPLSTAIRVLQERERRESEMTNNNSISNGRVQSPTPQTKTPPQSRGGTLGRDGTLSGEKLMISHGKRNFSVGSSATPKKITIRNEKLTPKPNLLGGEGKMSNDLKKLIAADEKPVELLPPPMPPQIKSPPSRAISLEKKQQTTPNEFRERHLRSPEAVEISNTLKRLISQDRVDTATLKANGLALPEDHKISDQLKKLILEDLSRPETPSTSTVSQSSSVSSIPEDEGKAVAKPVMVGRPSNGGASTPPGKINGSLIDTSIRIPLPPRVPSPPPLENPKKLNSQLSCDRLNREFQEFNAYRVVNPPSPKKIALPMDPNGVANFEKKTVVSFSQDLAGTPNRYPDTVKVVKLVQNGETVQKVAAMENIKFIIDPENGNVMQVSN